MRGREICCLCKIKVEKGGKRDSIMSTWTVSLLPFWIMHMGIILLSQGSKQECEGQRRQHREESYSEELLLQLRAPTPSSRQLGTFCCWVINQAPIPADRRRGKRQLPVISKETASSQTKERPQHQAEHLHWGCQCLPVHLSPERTWRSVFAKGITSKTLPFPSSKL